jgi:hypothetical protein
MPRYKSPFDELKTEVRELKKEVEVVKSTHVIHKDGTYSNKGTTHTTTFRLRPMEIFKTQKGSHFQVMKPLDHGAYVFGHPHPRQPRVDECDFWSWEAIEQAIKGN